MSDKNTLIDLPWDSDFFGIPMGQLRLENATSASIEDVLDKSLGKNLALLEAFCSAADEQSILALEGCGFHFAGIKAYASRPLGQEEPPFLETDLRFGPARKQDIKDLIAAFGGIYRDSRYYNYRCLDPGKIRELYETWIAKAVEGGYDDVCLVLRSRDNPAAFCSLRFAGETARIGLFGVAEGYRGKGIGLRLMAQVAAWLRPRQFRVISTATQGKNLSALRLYERAGFLLNAMEMCYYRRIS